MENENASQMKRNEEIKLRESDNSIGELEEERSTVVHKRFLIHQSYLKIFLNSGSSQK
jgi:hypothetical protein